MWCGRLCSKSALHTYTYISTNFVCFICLPWRIVRSSGHTASLPNSHTHTHVQGMPEEENMPKNLLLFLCTVLTAEHTEGLAVALVTSGLLQVAAEHCRRLADRRVRQKSRKEVRGL